MFFVYWRYSSCTHADQGKRRLAAPRRGLVRNWSGSWYPLARAVAVGQEREVVGAIASREGPPEGVPSYQLWPMVVAEPSGGIETSGRPA